MGIRGKASVTDEAAAGGYLIVPASRGLKAYSQSFMSFSLRAWRRIPRCFVHTANVFGV